MEILLYLFSKFVNDFPIESIESSYYTEKLKIHEKFVGNLFAS